MARRDCIIASKAKPASGRSWSASRSTPRSPRPRPSSSPAPRPRSAPSPTRRSAWSTRRCRACCRCPTASASARRCAPAWRSTRRSTAGAGSTARIISTPICRRAIRSASSTTRWSARAKSRSCSTRRTRASTKQIGIERIHVEQDAGKLMHDQHPTMSYVDLNRSGVALMEIVSRPDMRSPAEAGAYLRKLRAILRYVGSCDGNMEEGSMRADVNVSVRKPGGELGTRTETKNVNSVRFVMAVVEHEAQAPGRADRGRRRDRPGNPAVRPRQGRDALAAVEGRRARLPLFPRPRPASARARRGVPRRVPGQSLPELPDAKRKRYEALGITPYNASVLTAEVETARWFDALLEAGAEPQAGGELGRRRAVRRAQPARRDDRREPGVAGAGGRAARPRRRRHDQRHASPSRCSRSCSKAARAPAAIVESRGLKQTSDTGAIDAAIDKILAANADKVASIRPARRRCSASSSARR